MVLQLLSFLWILVTLTAHFKVLDVLGNTEGSPTLFYSTDVVFDAPPDELEN